MTDVTTGVLKWQCIAVATFLVYINRQYIGYTWESIISCLTAREQLRYAERGSNASKHKALNGIIFTALHGMQTRSCDENSVRLSVRETRAL